MRLRPDIARVTLARFIARMGGEAAFFVGVWGMAAYEFNADAGSIAVLMAVLAVAMMIGSALAGTAVDRYGPRTVLIASQFVYVPVILGVTLTTDMTSLVVMSALLGLTSGPIMTSTGSFAAYLATDDMPLDRVNALIEGAGALSFIVGPGLGALVAKWISLDAVFYLDAVCTVAGAALVWPVRTPPLGEHVSKGALAEIVDGLKVSYGLRSVRYYVLMGTLMWFSFGAFGALEPLFYRDVVGTGVEMIGYMNSLFGAGIAVGSWLLTRARTTWLTARTMALGAAAMGMCSILYVGTTKLPVIAVGALMWGLVIGAVEPLLRTLMQTDAPPEYVGRVMGTAQVHRHAGEVVPLALAPGLAAVFGVQPVMIGGGVVAAIVALSTLPVARSIDAARVVSVRGRRLDEAIVGDDPISPLT